MDIYYNNDYIACGYAFDTTRKSGQIAEEIHQFNKRQAKNSGPLAIVSNPSLFYKETAQIIETIHTPNYVEAVKSGTPAWLAESQGFDWDPNIYRMALAHCSGIVAAVQSALNGRSAGTLSSGLHHASASTGYGFCTFNGIAVGIQAARNRGAQNILVLDFDAHFGGGTFSLVQETVTHVDVSVDFFDYYEIDETSGMSYRVLTTPEDYVESISEALKFADQKTYDLVIYNAGMDPFNSDVDSADLSEREQMVADWIAERNYPSIFTLAGGYSWGSVTPAEIVDLHMLTISAFTKAMEGTKA